MLLSAAIRCIWADDSLWRSAVPGQRAEMMVRIAERANEPAFAAALRSLGLAKLAHSASQARPPEASQEQRQAFKWAVRKMSGHFF